RSGNRPTWCTAYTPDAGVWGTGGELEVGMGKKVFDLQNIRQSIRQYATEQKKKVLIGAIALVGLGAGAAGGTAYYQSQLVSLYPVTVDGTEVGLVSRPIVVEAWMEKTKNKVS